MIQDSLQTVLTLNFFCFFRDFVVINLLKIGCNDFLLWGFFITLIEDCSNIVKLIDVLFPWKQSSLDLELNNFVQMDRHQSWDTEIFTSLTFVKPYDWLIGDFTGQFLQRKHSLIQKYDISLTDLILNDIFDGFLSGNFIDSILSSWLINSLTPMSLSCSSHRKHMPTYHSPRIVFLVSSIDALWDLYSITQVWVAGQSLPDEYFNFLWLLVFPFVVSILK